MHSRALKYCRDLRVVVIVSSVIMGCGPSDSTTDTANDNVAAIADGKSSALAPEPWIGSPATKWPQIVLTNEAHFNGHTPLRGASAFLASTPDGRTIALTAKHLIGKAGGVDPPIDVGKLDDVLKTWKMFPRTRPNRFIEAAKIAVSGLDDKRIDWLVLSLQKTEDDLPARPLRMRTTPVEIGESVFLIGCAYADEDCIQSVYSGVVNERGFGDRFRFSLEPPVDLRGFSGAPIVDKHGHLVGVMTIWFEPRMQGEKYLECGGEDVTSILSLLQTE